MDIQVRESLMSEHGRRMKACIRVFMMDENLCMFVSLDEQFVLRYIWVQMFTSVCGSNILEGTSEHCVFVCVPAGEGHKWEVHGGIAGKGELRGGGCHTWPRDIEIPVTLSQT